MDLDLPLSLFIGLAGLAGLAGCEAKISDNPPDDGGMAGDAAASDAPGDAVALGPWSPPIKVAVASTGEIEDDVTLSSDARELIFAIQTGINGKDLYYTARTSLDAPWAPAVLLPFDGETTSEESPRFSADDKTLYFSSDRAGNGNLDIFTATRAVVGTNRWDVVSPIGGAINTTTLIEKWFMPCGTDRYVMVQNGQGVGNANATDLLEGRIGQDPVGIDVLNTEDTETGVFITRDCLTIYFASTRTDPEKIYTSRRGSLGAPWQPPMVVTDFEALGGDQEDPWLSPDGRIFAFVSNVSGTRDVYLSTR
jgi:WD40-like Beta Propeller Repeat